MNGEIKEILGKLKDRDETYQFCKQHKLIINDWTYEAHYLLDYITNLQQKVEQYENPEDLTLFYMWIDEKAKDKMKELQKENERLKDELETMTFTAKVKQEAIDALIKRIDKAIEYIQEDIIGNYFKRYDDEIYKMCADLLNILKGDDENEKRK